MIDPRVHPFNINKQQKVGGEQLTQKKDKLSLMKNRFPIFLPFLVLSIINIS